MILPIISSSTPLGIGRLGYGSKIQQLIDIRIIQNIFNIYYL